MSRKVGGGRMNMFLGGALITHLLVMNYVYENESMKQQVRSEIHKLKNIHDYSPAQISRLRNIDAENAKRSQLDNLDLESLKNLD